ncbi:bifunctional hydroxymethylpyrimidine kinase/phosphomethylpyrimidine kinase [Sphingomonas gilva]|uniref:hydroxymethylpyrimidine kinase n=1 Tax=Sphingomonas gilva TaxID=2305907 RepID=A0A396RT89_9SPHN|nr:bifunctional hydroxymethylpyrimidine kinase/phosphomethylpyrimidine kinase [Sphingomonas gilva]RHW17593.1 bifunctional hydroxymethylpyrimidine kinase/phosphomethylpyrimidine kinase [Sphingomonas gilva]
MTPRILIIAGSDSGGGAGIQADIRTVTMLGGHPMTAITALTAQNTLGVSDIMSVPADFVRAQIDAVAGDIGIDAVKIGMIGSAEIAEALIDWLGSLNGRVPVVFDPVMVATSGAGLADRDTLARFARLMALSTVVTPNLPELEVLTGERIAGSYALAKAARKLARDVGCAVLGKGGHDAGETVTDLLALPAGGLSTYEGARIDTRHSHGTGCTLASAVAVGLAEGMALPDAVARARAFVRIALKEAPGLGGGHGPMGHHKVRIDCAGGARPNQLTLPAADFAASEAFYRALGLTPIVRSEPRYARFEAADGNTLSIESADEIGGRAVAYFECSDLDGAIAALGKAGFTIDRLADDEDWGWREAHVTDPGGNAVRLYQAGENRRFPPWRLT